MTWSLASLESISAIVAHLQDRDEDALGLLEAVVEDLTSEESGEILRRELGEE